MNVKEFTTLGEIQAQERTVDKYWEAQWLIGYYSMDDLGRTLHDIAVDVNV